MMDSVIEVDEDKEELKEENEADKPMQSQCELTVPESPKHKSKSMTFMFSSSGANLLQYVVNSNCVFAFARHQFYGGDLKKAFEKDQVAHEPSGKPISGISPIEYALLVKDIAMLNAFKSYLDVKNIFKYGRKLIGLYNNFYSGDYESLQKEDAFKFDDIFWQIDRHRDNKAELDELIKSFQKEYKDKIFQEKVFNPWHLYNAYETYCKNSCVDMKEKLKELKDSLDKLTLDSSDEKKTQSPEEIFWVKVIGFVQSQMPVCKVNQLKVGMFGKYQSRSSSPYRSMPEPSNEDKTQVGLGFSYAIDAKGYLTSSNSLSLSASDDGQDLTLLENYKKLIEKNNKEIEDFILNVFKPEKNRHSVTIVLKT